MEAVAAVAGPVFGLGILGYIVARLGFFTDSMSAGLARFVFDYAIPAMLIRIFTTTELPAEIPWGLWISYFLPLYSVYLAGLLIARWRFKRNLQGQFITGFGCGFGNTILLGLPLIILTFGDAGVIPFFFITSIHGLPLFTITTIGLEYARNAEKSFRKLPKQIGKGLFKNPIILALLMGLVMNWLGWRLPGPVDRVAEYMQDAVTPCALFSLGATLTKYGIAGRITQAFTVIALKNLIMPAAVWVLAYYVFELPPLWAMAATLMAAQPSGVNFYLFAMRYNAATALATTTVFLSTLFAMGSVSLLLYLFQLVPT